MTSLVDEADTMIEAQKLCREHGMSSATLYKWRAKYGGMDDSLISESEPCPPLVRGQWRARWPRRTGV